MPGRRQEVVLLFLGFEALIEARGQPLKTSLKCVPGAKRDFVAHQHANLIDLLPFILQSQQRANLEVACCDVDPLGKLAPVVQVAHRFPVGVAVVNDEKFAACDAGTFGHLMIQREQSVMPDSAVTQWRRTMIPPDFRSN